MGIRIPSFTRQVLEVIALVTAVVVLLWLAWYVVDVLLLTFAGMLVAVLLSSPPVC